VHGRKPIWKTSSFLVYTGGLTVLFAAVATLAYLDGNFSKGALTAWAFLLLVILWLIAEALRVGGRWVAAGIFAFASVIAWGAFVGIAWWWFGWLNNWNSPFGGWSLAHLSLEFLILVAAITDRWRWDFPFITLIVALVGWFFVTDFVSGGGTWTYIVTLFIGLVYLLVGVASDTPSSFWWQFVAGLLIGIPLLHWWHTSTFEWALICAVAFVFVGLGYATRRSSWAVFAAIGFFAATIHFLVGSPTQLAEQAFLGSGGCVTNSTTLRTTCSSPASSVSTWSIPLAFGLLGLWLVLLGLAGRGARRSAAPAVPPAV
jgi:hypothetical protein